MRLVILVITSVGLLLTGCQTEQVQTLEITPAEPGASSDVDTGSTADLRVTCPSGSRVAEVDYESMEGAVGDPTPKEAFAQQLDAGQLQIGDGWSRHQYPDAGPSGAESGSREVLDVTEDGELRARFVAERFSGGWLVSSLTVCSR